MGSRAGLPSSPRPFDTPTEARPVPPTPPSCPPPLPPRSPAVQQLAPPLPASATAATTHTSADFPYSSLQLAPPAPPLPPRLFLTTSFPEPAPPPLTTSAATDALAPRHDELQSDLELPTYAHLQSQEVGNPRFGRWKGWIEKRARERKDEREALKEAGLQEPNGWDLPDAGMEGEERWSSAEPSFEDSEIRARNARAEQRLSRQTNNERASGMVGYTVANPDPPSSNPSFAAAAAAERELESSAMSPSSSLLGKGRVHELTRSIGIHLLGGRFTKGVEGRVRAGCLLPSGGGAGGNAVGDRFMLIGTDEGLTLLDLNPSLSHTAPLRTSAAPPLAEATLHPLWVGLGVLQLEVIVETRNLKSSGAPIGLVVGLVKPEGGEVELRMWSLAALSNLARWKVFNESSPPLDLSFPPASNASTTTSTEGKRSSRSYIKSLFSSSPTSPTDTKGKGKARALGSVPVPTPLHESTHVEEEFIVLGAGRSMNRDQGHSRTGSSASSTSGVGGAAPTTAESETRFFSNPRIDGARLSSESIHPSSGSSSVGRTTPTPTSPSNANLSLPFEWATSSLRFPLPKGTGPILFFTLCRTPPSGTEDHPRRDPRIMERRREKERKERGRVWLMVATTRMVYLYESREEGKRSWMLKREFYAPATPKQLTLIRSLPPHGPHSPPPTHSRGDSRKGKRSSSPPTSDADDLPADLTLFLTMRTKAVLINLVDSSVREVALPSAPASSGSAHTRSTSTLQTASSLTARAMEAGKSKMSAFVEGKQGIPVGMRGEGGKDLVKGKKVGVDGAVHLGGDMERGGDWVGCQLLSMGAREGGKHDVLILTKGSTAHIYPLPLAFFTPWLGTSSNTSSASASNTPSAPTPLPTPLATFCFPLTSSSPLVDLTTLIRHDLKTHYRMQGLQHLIITAWTKSGVHVKEGIIDSFGAERGGAGGKWFTPLDEFEKRIGESPLIPSSCSSPTDPWSGQLAAGKDEQEELGGQASLDFGREVLKLGVGGPSLHSSSLSTWCRPTGRVEDSDDDEDDEDDEESAFGAGRRGISVQEEMNRATEGGVFFCVKGVEDWGLKWVG